MSKDFYGFIDKLFWKYFHPILMPFFFYHIGDVMVGVIDRGFEPCTSHTKGYEIGMKKSLKIPKGQSESVNRTTDNTMAKR
jgi:hypothetical protein